MRKSMLLFIVLLLIVAGGCRITVAHQPGDDSIEVTGVSLDMTSLFLEIGDTYQFTATISPENATEDGLAWASDAPGIASVDETGLVKGLSAGTATITATTTDGGYQGSCEVIIYQGITIDRERMELVIDETDVLAATVSASLPDQTVTWVSSAPAVASVDDAGLVTALAEGSAIITAATVQGDDAQCEVTVLSPNLFISTWNLSNTIDNVLTLPLDPSGSYDFTVDWGDGTVEEINGSTAQHKYASSGPFTVKINGTIEGFGFSSAAADNKASLTGILQWGMMKFHNNGYQFSSCSSLNRLPISIPPDLTGITNIRAMFASASSFNQDISTWDTAQVTNMGGLFMNATSFNQDISSWDTSSVTNMSYMFTQASSFTYDLNAWDTSQVTDMSCMFYMNNSININITAWDTSRVTNMSNMFKEAHSFNQDLSGWDTSHVTNMRAMFVNAIAFNQDLSAWVTSQVTDMSEMFHSADAFNQDISSWDTSLVTDMAWMFSGAASFTNGGNPAGMNSWSVQASCRTVEMFDDCPLSPLPGWYP